jgi:hypothetical protein
MKSPLLRILLLVWLGASAGCISVPDYVKADMQAPDGERPNNFGKLIDNGEGRPRVEPDRPTIHPVVERS